MICMGVLGLPQIDFVDDHFPVNPQVPFQAPVLILLFLAHSPQYVTSYLIKVLSNLWISRQSNRPVLCQHPVLRLMSNPMPVSELSTEKTVSTA